MAYTSVLFRVIQACVPIFFIAFPVLALAQSAPLVNTLGPDYITEQSARLNGKVNPGGMADTYYWFAWSFAGRSQSYTTKKIRVGSTMREVHETIVGLAPNTTYCYVVVAENSRGKDTGQISCFTTKKLLDSAIPESRAITVGVKSILATSAIVRGYVAPHTTTATYWFEYGTTLALGQSSRTLTRTGASDYVEVMLTGLDPSTSYFYRIVSESGGKRWYGEVLTFRTMERNTLPIISQGTNTRGGNIVAPQTPRKPHVIEAVSVRPTTENVIVNFRWDLSGGVSYDIRSRGQFSVKFGPTKELNGGEILDHTPRGLVSGWITKIPNYSNGVYFQGSYSGSAIQFSGPIEYAAAPNKGGSGQQVAATSPRSVVNSTPTEGKSANLPGSGTSINNPFKLFDGTAPQTKTNSKFLGLFGGKQPTLKDDITLLQSTTGSRKPQEPIEYTIRYANDTGKAMTDTVLFVVFPKNVIYIGDDTNNEFLVEEDAKTGERTYILPIGLLSPGESRTITMMGMMTSDVTTNPSVRSRISYTDPTGQERVIFGETVGRDDIERHEKGEDVSAAEERAGAEGFFSRLFGGETARLKDDATVLYSVDGSKEVGSLVTYTVRYANETGETMTDAKLRFRLPGGIKYIGDSTEGEVVIEEDPATGEKIYTLPIGTLEPGEGRTITVTGRNTEGTSAFGDIQTEVVYMDESGNEKRVEGTTVALDKIRENERETPRASELAAAQRDEDRGWRVFPTTLAGWIFLIAALSILIFGWNKVRAWYLKKKKELEEEEKLRKEEIVA